MAKLKNPKLFSLMLNESQTKSLKVISGATLIPIAALVRMGVDVILERYQKEFKKAKKKGGE